MQVNEELKYTLSVKDLLNGKLKEIEKSIASIDAKMGRVQSKSDRLSSAIVGAFSTAAIIGFGQSVIDSLKNYEYFSASLRTLLHGDANAAKLLNSQLINLAKTSPFSLTDVQDSSKKLLAYGFAAKDVVTQMKMLGDVSAATGNRIEDIAYLYGTLRTQGTALTKDLREFTNRGINLIPLLAKQFKIAEKDVYKFAETGKIGFRDIELAFQTMTSKGGDFFNMMNEQSKTVGGRISNLGDSWEQLKIKIGQSQEGIISGTLRFTNSLVDSMNRGMDAMNMLSTSFKQFGAQDFSFYEKYIVSPLSKAGMMFGMKPVKGGYAEAQVYANDLKSNYIDKSSQSLSDAYKSQQSLSNIIANMYRDKEARKDVKQFNRTVATLKGALSQVQQNISALKSTGMNTPNLVDKQGVSNSPDLGGGSTTKEISGTKPQNIYITIGKQIETFNLHTTNIKEGYDKTKEKLTQVLAESVNDFAVIPK